MYNIDHCIEYNCVMCGFSGPEELNIYSMLMCPNCVHKLYIATRFDIIKRNIELKNFYLTHDMMKEYEILDKMIF